METALDPKDPPVTEPFLLARLSDPHIGADWGARIRFAGRNATSGRSWIRTTDLVLIRDAL